jgi:hypothetical protein
MCISKFFSLLGFNFLETNTVAADITGILGKREFTNPCNMSQARLYS